MTSILAAVALLGAIAAVAGIALGFAAVRWRREDDDPVVERIDALLPQTQCGQCGFPGCRPYAQALTEGRAEINLCPPGGEATVRSLARLLGRDEKPLVAPATPSNLRAVIDEDACVGCAICLQACPVDAILGAPRRMHTVIEDECTGCGLCVAPCPVDCIDMVAAENGDIPDFLFHGESVLRRGPTENGDIPDFLFHDESVLRRGARKSGMSPFSGRGRRT